MIERILLGVDDSPASLAAARAAVRLSASCHAALRVVHVLTDGALDELVTAVSREAGPGGPGALANRRARAGTAVLDHVADLAARAGVDAQTCQLAGEPADVLLAEVEEWAADILVLGRGDRPADRRPAVGPQARRVLEFASRPVLVVPPASRGHRGAGARAGSR
jgi:nucleotide-binding universal stress UspA family protein